MINHLDKLLEEQGLKYEDLNYEEREFYNKASFSTKGLSISDLKEKILELKDSIAMQLADTPDNEGSYEKNRTLKARLQNYITLYAFLVTPEKAEQALKRALDNKQNNNL